jgi:hypothetical protein
VQKINKGECGMKTLARALLLLVGVVFLVACERAADIGKPNDYAKAGMRFSYPVNWKVDEDTEDSGVRHLVIESSGDAIFVVHVFPREVAFPLQDYAQGISDEVSANLPVGKQVKSRFKDVRKDVQGVAFDAIEEQFELEILGQSVPHERWYYRKEGAGGKEGQDRVVMMFHQVASEDLDKVKPGFDLILRSLTLQE